MRLIIIIIIIITGCNPTSSEKCIDTYTDTGWCFRRESGTLRCEDSEYECRNTLDDFKSEEYYNDVMCMERL